MLTWPMTFAVILALVAIPVFGCIAQQKFSVRNAAKSYITCGITFGLITGIFAVGTLSFAATGWMIFSIACIALGLALLLLINMFGELSPEHPIDHNA